MKLLFLITLISFSVHQLSAQQIGIHGSFGVSSINKFQTNVGYGAGYDQFIASNKKIGLSFSHSFNHTGYSQLFYSDADGREYIQDIKPKNQCLAFKISYSFDVLKKQRSDLFIGPEIGVNFFKIDEKIIENIADNEEFKYTYQNTYWEKGKFGIGLLVEYTKTISDRISVDLSALPEIISYAKVNEVGTSESPLVTWVDFHIGIEYSLSKSRMNY